MSVFLALVAAIVFSTTFPALAGEMDANAKALAKLDDDWSPSAGTKEAALVASVFMPRI